MNRIESLENKPLETGHRLGPWRVIEPAGEGGFGKVYRGERADGAFDKTVAIKLLRLRGTGLSEQLQRECQLLARIDHHAVARLLDAGLDEQAGPFLVMEWIEGQDLPDWLDSEPSRQRCMDVMMSLCEAVDHAHRQLIVHGDIKPGNVRIDAGGGVKLLDFGIARLFDKAEEQDATIAALTPTFSPPEQRRGERLDARSDVWSLGMLLSWMLQGGRLPGQHEYAETVSIPKGVIGAELCALIEKACAADPEERYASVHELLADLRRFKQQRPLAALPATRGYHVRKFLRRNPVFVGGVTATAGALLVGLITTVAWYLEADNRAEELARVVDFQVQQLSGIEPREMGQMLRQELIDQRREALATSGATDDKIDEALKALDEALAGVNFTNSAMNALDASVFSRSQAVIDETFADKPNIRASLLQSLASTMREVGLLNQAVPPQAAARALRADRLGEQDPATMESVHESGVLAHALSDYDASRSHLEQALKERREALGGEHPETLESAHALAETLRRLGHSQQSEKLTRQVLQARRDQLGADHPDTLAALAELAAVMRAQGRLDEAEPYYRQVADRREQLLGSDHPDTLTAMNNLGLLLVQRDQHGQAEPVYRETLRRRQAVLGDDHPSTLITLNNLAALMRLKEQYDQAEDYYRDAIELAKRIYGPHHLETANLFNNLGVLNRTSGRLAASRRNLKRALEGRRQALGADHRSTLIAKHNLARTLLEAERLKEANQLQERAVAGIEKAVSPTHWFRAAFLGNHGRILIALENFEQAESALLTAHRIHSEALGPEHHRTVENKGLLGTLYDEWARHEPGSEHAQQRDKWLARSEKAKEGSLADKESH